MGSCRERKLEGANVSTDLVYLINNYKVILAASSPTLEGMDREVSSSQDLLGDLETSLGRELNFVPFSAQINWRLLSFLLPSVP